MTQDPAAPPAASAEDSAENPRVAEALARVRSGVRQRQAEVATAGGGPESGNRINLVDLRAREYVREPVPFSHRPGLGRFIVLVRKAVYQLFQKWLTQPLLEQQNGFNQTAARGLAEVVAAQEMDRQQLHELAHRLADAERRLALVEAAPILPVAPGDHGRRAD